MSRAATRNVTIVLESQVARWVRRAAAEQDLSVSRFLGRLLKERMLADHGYALAMQDFLAEQPVARREPGPYPSRDEIHERR
jgi:hypothetical protein